MGGGKDTVVGRADVIPDGEGPIYVSEFRRRMHQCTRPFTHESNIYTDLWSVALDLSCSGWYCCCCSGWGDDDDD